MTPNATRQLKDSKPATRMTLALATWAMLSTATVMVAHQAHAAPPPTRYAPDRILVEPKAGLSDAVFARTLADNGLMSKGRIRGINAHVVTLGAGQDAQAMAAAMARHPNVKFAELDRLVPHAAAFNDPMVGYQWHLPVIGAPTAWDSASGAGTVIAILDSGVDATHPDLAGQLVTGWNFYDNNADTTDVTGHGTAVAGAAAAASNNATGIEGLAYGAKLMPVRIADTTGYAYWSTIAQALTWAADNGARVANISFGGVAGSSAIQSSAQYMRGKGGVVVVSAGNAGVNDGVADTDTMIVVSATDRTDALTTWSTYGASVDLSAPGLDIAATSRGGGYSLNAGTSFSSPIVAAVAALVRSANAGLTAAQVEQALFSTAVDLGAAGRDIYYGYGRVNAAGAVAAARTMTVDAQAPVASIASPLGGTVNGTVAVSVGASDNVGVAKVEFRVNGVLVATDTAAPYAFSWNSASVADGTASLTAVAYDAAGNAGTSAAVSVTVANTIVDTTPPTVVISNPVNGAKLSGTSVTVTGSASDVVGIGSMVMYLDGRQVATSSSGSLSYKWNLKNAAAGSHTISVTAKDKAGNASTKSVSVTK